MIKAIKNKDDGLDVSIDGYTDELFAEFCFIVESLMQKKVIDAENYLACWSAVNQRLKEENKE